MARPVPKPVLDRWMVGVGNYLICQIETYAVLSVRESLADSSCAVEGSLHGQKTKLQSRPW